MGNRFAISTNNGIDSYSGETQESLETLKARLNELGAPKLEGTDTVAGKPVPAIYFGKVKIDNTFFVSKQGDGSDRWA